MTHSARGLAIFLLVMMLIGLAPLAVSANSVDDLYTIHMDNSSDDDWEDQYYIKGRWIQVAATVAPGAKVKVSIYRDDQENGSNAHRVYTHTSTCKDGNYLSPKVQLQFVRSATVPYRIDVYENGDLKYSGYIHRMLLKLRNDQVCTRGIRFRDINDDITKAWSMFTPIRLGHIDDGGTHKLQLVASNMYLVGYLSIERDGHYYRFTIQTIDEWNDDHGVETPDGPHDVTDHEIDVTGVRIGLFSDLDDVQKRGLNDRHYRLNEWYKITHTNQLLYFSGKIDYDPNGLERAGDSFNSQFTQRLVDLMDNF